MKEYDVIIIGGGPAGFSAAIYSGRYKLKTLVLSEVDGGLAATAHKVCNFPSYKEINGFELMQNMKEQAKELNAEIKNLRVVEILKKNDQFTVKTNEQDFIGKKIILATGTKHRELNIKGEKEFIGKGVSYCATCDGAFFRDVPVAVIGGGNSALTAALLLTEYASKVYIIYRREKFFRAEPSWIELLEKNDKIEFLFNEEIIEIKGETMVNSVALKSGNDLKVNGIFVEAGSIPDKEFLKNIGLNITDRGYIITNQLQETNIEGLYAAGDVTNHPLKQIITAGAQGATATFAAYQKIISQR